MTQRLCLLMLSIALLLDLIDTAPGQAQEQPRSERIALAAYRNGQWDLYSIAPDGTDPRQLTNDPFEDTDPVYAPDGTKIAFASRRDSNWDLYLLDLPSGELTRLTSAPHYDGAPTWSPDGTTLAYESFAGGDLDIWLIDAAGSEPPVNLTGESEAGEFSPAWSPDGKAIAFSSWREGNRDLYLFDVTTGDQHRLTDTPVAEEGPAWHPDGEKLAFVVDDLGDREIFMLDITESPVSGGVVQPVTWLGRTDAPAWSPDGTTLAAVFRRWDGEILMKQASDGEHQLPDRLTGVIAVQGRLSWHAAAVEFGQPLTTLADPGLSSLYEEGLSPNGESNEEPYNLVRLNDVETGTPWLADTVDDSFQRWRLRLRDEVGYDFLGRLSDASRDVGQYSDTSQYASWHKSGRAVDTLFDYHLGGELAHEIVREDYSGETFWRIYLRCTDQSGRCGRPLTANAWNYSARARTEIAPEQGGIEKANLTGYYVDMTAMAREYGWQRISSFDDEDYSWTWHFLAFEYWHYQKPLADRDARTTTINWYQAMSQVYPPDTLDRFFTWQKMREIGEDPHLIALKGVPLPLEAKPWWKLVKQ